MSSRKCEALRVWPDVPSLYSLWHYEGCSKPGVYVQEEMRQKLVDKGLVRLEAGAEESPALTRSMLRPAYDEVLKRGVVAHLATGRRPCSSRSFFDARPLTGGTWSWGLKGASARSGPMSSALLSNSGTLVRCRLDPLLHRHVY
jgi:hypothetical protein